MMNWLKFPLSSGTDGIGCKEAFTLFKDHWEQALVAMARTESEGDIEIVVTQFDQMLTFFRVANQDTDNEKEDENKCKKFWMNHNCSQSLLSWLYDPRNRGLFLTYQSELKLVNCLSRLCELYCSDIDLMGRWTDECVMESWNGVYALSSLLLEYSVRGEQSLAYESRKTFVRLIRLIGSQPELEQKFTQESGLGLTNVIISGLSACFAQLPTCTYASQEQLGPFIEQLKFIESIAQNTTNKVSEVLADCFYNAFLSAVLLPSICQDDSGCRNMSTKQGNESYITSLNEEIAVVTSYLEIVLENISHPVLIKALVLFSILHLIPILISRISHPSSLLCSASLSALNTMLKFYCEDIWFELILQYLVSQSHLMASDRFTKLSDSNNFEASRKYFSLLPNTINCVEKESIAVQFILYTNNELRRWPLSCSSTGGNPIFSTWKFKYDGSENLTHLLKDRYEKLITAESLIIRGNRENLRPSKDAEEVPSQNCQITEAKNTSNPDLDEKFSNVPLLPSPGDPEKNGINEVEQKENHDCLTASDPLTILASEQKFDSLNGNRDLQESEGYSSLSSGAVFNSENSFSSTTTFGPFLDSLFEKILQWHQQPLHLILNLSEIVSTIASSRLPLVSTLFLNPLLTLQPSYTSFPIVLLKIQKNLERMLQGRESLFLNIWHSIDKELSVPEPIGLSSSKSMPFDVFMSTSSSSSSGFSSLENSFTEQLKKFKSSQWASALNNVFGRRSSLSASSSRVLLNHSNEPLNSATSVPSRHSEHSKGDTIDKVKLMAIRAVYFSHWMLELAAIAQNQSTI